MALDASRGLCEDLAAGRDPRLPSSVDPGTLRTAIAAHGLSGLAARAIEEDRLVVDAGLAEEIRSDWTAARRWATVLDLECERIGRAAAGRAAAGRAGAGRAVLSAPILLKGPAVARRYRDPAVRTYTDIDLLVPAGEMRAWTALLRALGYSAGNAWDERTALLYSHHVGFRRPLGGGTLLCEVHTSLFLDRRARGVVYRSLAPRAEPGRFAAAGVLELAPGAQLVALALHFAHHPRETRRLIWLRDFIELGTTEAVEGARLLAGAHGVGWALERALLDAEVLLGRPAWDALAPPDERFGLARVVREGEPGLRYHLALARELGPAAGVAYLASRFDLRRFLRPPGGRGGFDGAELRAWAARAWRTTRGTRWRRRP